MEFERRVGLGEMEWRRPVLSGKRERFGVRIWGELGVVSVMRRWHGGSSGIMGNEKQS